MPHAWASPASPEHGRHVALLGEWTGPGPRCQERLTPAQQCQAGASSPGPLCPCTSPSLHGFLAWAGRPWLSLLLSGTLATAAQLASPSAGPCGAAGGTQDPPPGGDSEGTLVPGPAWEQGENYGPCFIRTYKRPPCLMPGCRHAVIRREAVSLPRPPGPTPWRTWQAGCLLPRVL